MMSMAGPKAGASGLGTPAIDDPHARQDGLETLPRLRERWFGTAWQRRSAGSGRRHGSVPGPGGGARVI